MVSFLRPVFYFLFPFSSAVVVSRDFLFSPTSYQADISVIPSRVAEMIWVMSPPEALSINIFPAPLPMFIL